MATRILVIIIHKSRTMHAVTRIVLYWFRSYKLFFLYLNNALSSWGCAGLEFFQSKAEIILKLAYHHLPRWFVIVFPAMVELAQATGLDLALTQGSETVLADVLCKRQQLLDMYCLLPSF